jgi:hypothetical protein
MWCLTGAPNTIVIDRHAERDERRTQRRVVGDQAGRWWAVCRAAGMRVAVAAPTTAKASTVTSRDVVTSAENMVAAAIKNPTRASVRCPRRSRPQPGEPPDGHGRLQGDVAQPGQHRGGADAGQIDRRPGRGSILDDRAGRGDHTERGHRPDRRRGHPWAACLGQDGQSDDRIVAGAGTQPPVRDRGQHRAGRGGDAPVDQQQTQSCGCGCPKARRRAAPRLQVARHVTMPRAS